MEKANDPSDSAILTGADALELERSHIACLM